MLLLKKKKYAALVINEHANGTITYDKEMKGLDLVRRDWCPVSKDTGAYCVMCFLLLNVDVVYRDICCYLFTGQYRQRLFRIPLLCVQFR